MAGQNHSAGEGEAICQAQPASPSATKRQPLPCHNPCYRCRGAGHIAHNCLAPTPKQNQKQFRVPWLGQSKGLYLHCQIEGHSSRALVDTGSGLEILFFTWEHWCSQIQKVRSTSKNLGARTKMKGKPKNILYKNIPDEGCSEKNYIRIAKLTQMNIRICNNMCE